VEVHAVEAGFPDKVVSELKIAVDEACTNVIEHAYKGAENRDIDVDVIIQADRFTVRIRDEGDRFDEGAYDEPDIFAYANEGRAGGFGVHIMRRLMDRVEYRTRGKSNECCLVKYR